MRILLGFILALSVSFACDQPYEEVGGYKIGCPFEYDGAIVTMPLGFSDGVINVVHEDGFFDVVAITEIDGKIEAIMFKRSEPESSDNDYAKKLLRNLSDRWGDFYEVNSGVYRKHPGGILSQILLVTPESGVGEIVLIYESKTFADKQYQSEMKKIKSIDKEFSRF